MNGTLCGLRVIVAEDVMLNRKMLCAMLEGRGIIVDEARDGKEAAELFLNSCENFYAAVLMDIHMPVMNGYEAVGVIRTSNRSDAEKIPVIAMTGGTSDEEIQQSVAAGMNAHVGKPIDVEAVFNLLEKLCI